jgi:mono/diheme cytochrome c family protein
MNSTLPRQSHFQASVKCLLCAAPIALLASSALAASQGDSNAGKRLYDANCMGCHDTSVYSRKTRSVRSLDALKQQLESCGHASDKNLSPADRQNIVRYLNDQFYQFR